MRALAPALSLAPCNLQTLHRNGDWKLQSFSGERLRFRLVVSSVWNKNIFWSLNIFRPDLEERLEEIISGAALLADSSCTRDDRRERIVMECNAVRQALQVSTAGTLQNNAAVACHMYVCVILQNAAVVTHINYPMMLQMLLISIVQWCCSTKWSKQSMQCISAFYSFSDLCNFKIISFSAAISKLSHQTG